MRKLLVGLIAVGLLAGPAGATFPGRNGLIVGEPPCGHPACALLLLDVAAKSPKLVGIGDHPAWSPDGKRLVIGEAHTIEIATVEGMRLTSRRVLVRQADRVRWVGFPSWSGDGRYVVYVQGEPDRGSDIYKVRVADGRTFRLTHAPRSWFSTDPAWSPDSSTIAYTACNPSGSRCALDLMDADGSQPRILLSRPGLEVNDPKWSPNGKKLGLSLQDEKFNTWTAILDLAWHKLRRAPGEAFETWTPDGRHIVVRVEPVNNPAGCNWALAIMTGSGESVRDPLPGCLYTGDWQPLH